MSESPVVRYRFYNDEAFDGFYEEATASLGDMVTCNDSNMELTIPIVVADDHPDLLDALVDSWGAEVYWC